MRKPPLFLSGLCLALFCHGQSGLYISGNLSINANTIISVDGLTLTPSSTYSLAGANSLTRKTTLTHPSITPAINRSFQWSATPAPFTGSIGFYYEETELNSLLESELTLNVHDGSQWQAYKTGISRNTANNLVTTPVSNLLLNEVSLAAEAHPLPLTWGSITANRKKGTAFIVWQTYNERQTAFFEVERSADGMLWNTIGGPVPAANTSNFHQYHFSDSTVLNNKTFYRIKQVDRDQQFSYSSIAWVPAIQSQSVVSIYPNPATHQVSIQSSITPLKTLHIYDVNGQLIKTAIVPAVTTYALSVITLPKGVYTVQVKLTDGTVTHLSFIKN